MKPNELLKYYPNMAAISRKLKCTEAAVGQWFKAKQIPEKQQYRLALLHPDLRVDVKFIKELTK